MKQTKRLTRSSTDRKLMGVCGGLGEYFGIDATVFRVIFIVLFFAAGFGPLTYFILGLIMPYDYQVNPRETSHRNPFQAASTRNRSGFTGEQRRDVTPEDEENWSDF